jgi:succinate dehydrogenase hydrophobic anchor subunit
LRAKGKVMLSSSTWRLVSPNWMVRGVRSMVMVMVVIWFSFRFVVNRDTSMKTLFEREAKQIWLLLQSIF